MLETSPIEGKSPERPCDRGFPPRASRAVEIAFALLLVWVIAMLSLDPSPLEDYPLSPLRRDILSWTPLAIVAALTGLNMARRRAAGATGALDRTARRAWPFILCAAFALRLSWVLLSGVEQTSDFFWYDQAARGIVEGRSIAHPARYIGAPLFFALHYKFMGYNQTWPLVSLALLSGLQVALVHRLIRRITSTEAPAVFGAALLAFWPEHILYCNLLGTDVLFPTGILGAAAFLFSRRASRGRLAPVAAAGALLGISFWIRPTATFVVAAALIVPSSTATWRRHLGTGALLLACFLILVTPISWLNLRAHGRLSLGTDLSGINLLIGTNLEKHGRPNPDDWALIRREVAASGIEDEGERWSFQNRLGTKLALERIRENPTAFVRMALRDKLPYFWGRVAGLGWSLRTSCLRGVEGTVWWLADLWHRAALTLLAVSLFILAFRPRRRGPFHLLLAAACLTTILHIFYAVQPRYHHLFLPLFCMGISLAFDEVRAMGSPSRTGIK